MNTTTLAGLDLDYIRVSEAVRLFSISRSRIYELIGEGEIPSVNLRKRGAKKGIRVICYQGMKKYFADRLEGGSMDNGAYLTQEKRNENNAKQKY